MWAGTQRKCHATIIGDKFEVIGKNCRFLHTIHIKLRRKPSATAPSKVQQYLGDREGDVVSEVVAKIPGWGKMSEFESRIGRDGSESEDRSRSERIVHTSALQVRVGGHHLTLSVPNQCPPQMIENQISCKMWRRIKVLMEHFRSFCNQPNIHEMCQGIHFKRHRGRGWVQMGHLVLHLHKRTLGTSCAFPCIGIGIGIGIYIYMYKYINK